MSSANSPWFQLIPSANSPWFQLNHYTGITHSEYHHLNKMDIISDSLIDTVQVVRKLLTTCVSFVNNSHNCRFKACYFKTIAVTDKSSTWWLYTQKGDIVTLNTLLHLNVTPHYYFEQKYQHVVYSDLA